MTITQAQLDRRHFLQFAGVAGLTIAGLPALASCAPGATTEWTRTLDFVGWDYQPDTIKEFVSGWGTENDVTVDVTIIPSLGYSAALQSRLRGGANADVYYNFAYASQKFVEDEWAQTLSDLPQADEALADMFENSRSQYVDTDGNLISLPYFSAVDMNIYNTKMLAAAGIAEPPATLEDYYTQSKALKEQGVVDSPFLGFWDKNVLEHCLITYLLMAGITPFDEAGEPVFADDSKTEDVMTWWQTMYQEGLVQESAFTDDPGKLITAMANGQGAFWIVDHYVMKNVVETAGPSSLDVLMVPPVGGNLKTLQFGEVIQMGGKTSGEARDAAWDLMKFYGWKDKAGEFSTFRAWAVAANLLAPYPGVFADPEVRSAFGDYMNLPLIEEVFQSKSDNVPARILPWYPAFGTSAAEVLQKLILGQIEPKQAVTDLAAAVATAKQGGGL